MLVQLDHFPKKGSGWKIQRYLSCHHLVMIAKKQMSLFVSQKMVALVWSMKNLLDQQKWTNRANVFLKKRWHPRILLEPQTTLYRWLFQLDDSKSLYRKCSFHQTSIYKWLFGVPGFQNWGENFPSLLEIKVFFLLLESQVSFFLKAIVAGFRGKVAFKKHRTLGVLGTFFFPWEIPEIWEDLGWKNQLLKCPIDLKKFLNFMNPSNSLTIFPEKKGPQKKKWITVSPTKSRPGKTHRNNAPPELGGEKSPVSYKILWSHQCNCYPLNGNIDVVPGTPRPTIYKWMFGETTIFYIKKWNHPIETTI